MTGKEFLRNVREARDTIKALKEKQDAIESSLTGKAIRWDPNRVQTSGARDAMFENIPEVADLQTQIEKEIAAFAQREALALKLTQRIGKWNYRTVIVYYYMQGLTLEATADRMGKSYTWICTTIRQAEKEFEKLWEVYRSEHPNCDTV